MSEQNLLQYQEKDHVLYLTLNRPEKRNALNAALVTSLINALENASQNASIRIIVLRANGKVFSAGADLEALKQLQNNTFDENLADSQHLKELFVLIYNCPKVIIGEVQGHAIAGGCGLATVCDFSFSAPHAKFGYTETKIGFIPALVSVFLIRKIGEGKAREILLSGNLFTAEKAKEIGIVNDVIDASELSDYVTKFAQDLIQNCSPNSLAMTKHLISSVQHMEISEALNYAAQLNAKARESDDCKKGIGAFLNKEKITWN